MVRSLSGVVALLLVGCQVAPTNPFDPETPLEDQAPCAITGVAVITGRAVAEGITVTTAGQSAVTAEDGTYTLINVPPGTHELVAVFDDAAIFKPARAVVACAPGTAVAGPLLEIGLETGVLSGVARLDGAPSHQGIQVAAVRAAALTGEERARTVNAVTSSDGTYLLQSVPVGTYRMVAQRDGYAPQDLEVVVTRNAQTIAADISLAPLTGLVEINEGARVTADRDVQVRILSTNVELTHMKISEQPSVADAALIEFASEVDFRLSEGDGEKSVFVQLFGAGTETAPIEGRIVLDTTAPTLALVELDDGAEFTTAENGVARLRIDASDNGTGIDSMRVSVDGALDDELPVPFASVGVVTLPLVQGAREVIVEVADRAGNVARPLSDTIVRDTEGPVLGLVPLRIGDGDGVVFASAVGLTLDASGASSMVISNQPGGAGAQFFPFATSVTWDLLPGEGLRTVYLRFLDDAGNQTAELEATVEVLFRGDIVGRVRREDGGDPSGALVTVNGTALSGAADANGDFVIPRVPQGLHAVSASLSGFQRFDYPPITVTPGARSALAEATLRRARGTIEGLALLQGQQSHENIEITIDDTGFRTFTDLRGAWRIEVPVGNYSGVSAAHPSARFGDAGRIGTISVLEEGAAIVPVLTLPQLANNIVGRVEIAGEPDDAGAEVVLSDLSGPIATATTVADGGFAFTDLPVGSYVLGISFLPEWETRSLAVNLGAGPPLNVGDQLLRERFLVINGDAPLATSRLVTLRLGATDAATMQISEDPTFSGAPVVTFASTAAFSLTSDDGPVTVFARFFDNGGGQLGTAEDTITLDATSEILSFVHDAPGPLIRNNALRLTMDTGERGGVARVDIVGYQSGLVLHDDGLAGDAAADDGVYTLLFAINQPLDVEGAPVVGRFTDPNGLASAPVNAASLSVRARPLVSGVEVLPDSVAGVATIRWQTDEITTGFVDHGPTELYGSTISSPAGTRHEVVIAGLTPSSVVNFQIRATDTHTVPSTTTEPNRSFVVAPLPPDDVVAIPGVGRVDVHFRKPAQRGIVGYFVHRQEGAGPVERLNSAPFPADYLLFSDGGPDDDNTELAAVVNGSTYSYFVSSLDRFGNEGPLSPASAARPEANSGPTDLCGVTGTVILSSIGAPYRLTCSFIVDAGSRLIMGPGTTVSIPGNELIEIRGELLIAGGRTTDPVVLGQPGDNWIGLVLKGDQGQLHEIERAELNGCSTCLAPSTSTYDLVVRNSSILARPNNFNTRFQAGDAASTVRFEGSVIAGLVAAQQITGLQRAVTFTGNTFIARGTDGIDVDKGFVRVIGNSFNTGSRAVRLLGGGGNGAVQLALNDFSGNSNDLFAFQFFEGAPFAVRYNQLASNVAVSVFGLFAPELDFRENHWGPVATPLMLSGGTLIDVPTIVDSFEDPSSARVVYDDFIVDPIPFAGAPERVLRVDVKPDVREGRYLRNEFLWTGSAFFSTQSETFDLLVDAPLANSIQVFAAPDFGTALVEGVFDGVTEGRATVTLPSQLGHHPLVVVLEDGAGGRAVELLHLIFDDGTPCPGQRLVEDPGLSVCEPL